VNPAEHLLPWRVETRPPGARARFSDGTTRVAPFMIETAPGEHADFTLELQGYESTRITRDMPGNVSVLMSRLPDRWWRTTARVDAPPVAVEDDHVVCNRAGVIARLSAEAEPRWSQSLESLGGVARAPVFLPRRPGCLLIVTEDGQAWLAEAADGKLEGPWNLDSPPIDGPTATGRSVEARFSDGKSALWETRLKPESVTLDAVVERPSSATALGSSAGMEVLRRRNGPAREFHSPWSSWTITIDDKTFTVRKDDASDGEFHVRRVGEWVYLAWEAPSARCPRGRLWVSDGAGLRAFAP
jgi:hypothetical protein